MDKQQIDNYTEILKYVVSEYPNGYADEWKDISISMYLEDGNDLQDERLVDYIIEQVIMGMKYRDIKRDIQYMVELPPYLNVSSGFRSNSTPTN